MKNQFTKGGYQMMFFDLIRKIVPENHTLVDVVSDLLNVSTDAAYRRIRGVKLLDFEEVLLLCNHFRISLDSFTNITDAKNIQCRYTPIDLSDMKNHLNYLHDLSASIESVRLAHDGEIIFSAVDVPIYHYAAYKELTLFKLFSWNSSVYGFTGNYDEFIKRLEFNEILHSYKKIIKNYQLCPSTEIWADYTIDKILGLLQYHHEMGHFNDEKFPLFLCEQLLDLTGTLHCWTEKNSKGSKNTPFRFYVTDIDMSNTFALFKKNGTINCSLKLFTINHFDIFDQRFCRETEKWLNTAIQRSTLISGSAEKQRHRFFTGQKQKICSLMDKLLSEKDNKKM